MRINWPDISNNQKLSEHQKKACKLALSSRVGVLCGSPGVGKTFCLAEIAKAIIDQFGEQSLVVVCPTGKASVRITESMMASGVNLRAKTIHSILGIGIESGGEPSKTLDFSFVLIDEASMIDTSIACSLMKSCDSTTRILWTGDPNQLPPVGHGAPLRDLIAAGVPYGELTEIVRNSGGIVETCAAIRDQKAWAAGGNLLLVDDQSQDKQAAMGLIIKEAEKAKINPVWDLQFVCAVNEKSPLSRIALNKFLQSELNHQPGEVSKAGFRAGDKIVCTKNSFYKSIDAGSITLDDEIDSNARDEVYAANGELGRVIECDDKSMIIHLDSPTRTIQVYFGADGGCTFELGYALSVHKSQGSDWPWVVVMLDDYAGAKMVCDRSWLYTAISRAKSKCWMVGKKQTAVRMCRVSKIWHRKTFLKELILMGKARGRLADV